MVCWLSLYACSRHPLALTVFCMLHAQRAALLYLYACGKLYDVFVTGPLEFKRV